MRFEPRTEYIANIPNIRTKVEYNVGLFTADSVKLTATDINYWTQNIFTDSFIEDFEQNQEFVITAQLIQGSRVTEEIVVFFGYVVKDTIEYDNNTNTLSFSVATPETLLDSIPAWRINTQYIDTVFGTEGIALKNIPGQYITAITSETGAPRPPLGPLEIIYSYTDSTLSLGGGRAIPIEFISSDVGITVIDTATEQEYST